MSSKWIPFILFVWFLKQGCCAQLRSPGPGAVSAGRGDARGSHSAHVRPGRARPASWSAQRLYFATPTQQLCVGPFFPPGPPRRRRPLCRGSRGRGTARGVPHRSRALGAGEIPCWGRQWDRDTSTFWSNGDLLARSQGTPRPRERPVPAPVPRDSMPGRRGTRTVPPWRRSDACAATAQPLGSAAARARRTVRAVPNPAAPAGEGAIRKWRSAGTRRPQLILRPAGRARRGGPGDGGAAGEAVARRRQHRAGPRGRAPTPAVAAPAEGRGASGFG